jgi:recombination protein RecR
MPSNDALPIVVLAEKFAALPGIGKKSAQRLAYHVLSMDNEDVKEFAQALLDAKKKIHRCSICRNLTELDVCPICSDMNRTKSMICVVESPKDVSAFERTGEYNGTYHVLHGLISPLDGVSPEHLEIHSLLDRVNTGEIEEVVMATNPTVEGDATAMYIASILKPLNVKVSRLAFGLPVGGVLEYADEVTLYKALENRNIM